MIPPHSRSGCQLKAIFCGNVNLYKSSFFMPGKDLNYPSILHLKEYAAAACTKPYIGSSKNSLLRIGRLLTGTPMTNKSEEKQY